MTTFSLIDFGESSWLRQKFRKGMEYYMRKEEYLEALSMVEGRKDIVKLVNYGLRKHHIVEAARRGKGKELLKLILDHAGIVWISNYLSALDREQVNALVSEGYLPKELIDKYYDKQNNNIIYYLLRTRTKNQYEPYQIFYSFLVIFGHACDIESLEEIIGHIDPTFYYRNDVRKLIKLYVSIYGTEDPISKILKIPKHYVIMEDDMIKEFHNIYGGIYKFEGTKNITVSYQGPSRGYYTTRKGTIVQPTYYGIYINSTVIPANKDEQYIDYDDITIMIDYDGNNAYIDNFPPELRVGRGFPILGIDLYHLVEDLRGTKYISLIPRDIYSDEILETWGDEVYFKSEQRYEERTIVSYYPETIIAAEGEFQYWIIDDGSGGKYVNFLYYEPGSNLGDIMLEQLE